MDKLKEPGMVLSVANSIGLVGITAYFYKQNEALKLEMLKLTQTLTGVIRKISDMEKGDQNKSDVLHTLHDQIKSINEKLEDMPNIETDLTELFTTLEDEHGILVERPSLDYNPRQSKRGSSRKHNSRRNDPPPQKSTRERQERAVNYEPETHRKYLRQEGNDNFQQPIRQQSVPSSRREVAYEDDDAADLINAVRLSSKA